MSYLDHAHYIGTVKLFFMTKEEWDVKARIGFGGRYWQEYSLDKKGYLLVYTSVNEPEFPENLPYIIETRSLLCYLGKGAIYEFAMAI